VFLLSWHAHVLLPPFGQRAGLALDAAVSGQLPWHAGDG
jgi:hypothetical protein